MKFLYHQLTVNSVTGLRGHRVQSRAELEWRTEHARACHLNHSLAGNLARSRHWDQVWRRLSAIWRRVQVSENNNKDKDSFNNIHHKSADGIQKQRYRQRLKQG